jgi:hypothetical protein
MTQTKVWSGFTRRIDFTSYDRRTTVAPMHRGLQGVA